MKTTRQSKSTATCPTEIKIVGKVYRVEKIEDLPDQGNCNNQKLQIMIQNGNALQQEQDTVLHEVLHAIDYSVQAKMNERQITVMASGLLSVMQENPQLMGYLLGRSKGK